MQIPLAPVEKPDLFRGEPGRRVEGVLFKQEVFVDVERYFLPFRKPRARRRNEDPAVEVGTMRRDA